jgi:hypothetical protein
MTIWENITLAKKSLSKGTLHYNCEEVWRMLLLSLGMENARRDLEVRRCIRWNKLVKMEGN